MPKTANHNHPVEKALCEIEEVLNRNHLQLEHVNGAFRFTWSPPGGKPEQFEVMDFDMGNTSGQLPRSTDGEKLKLLE